MRNVERIAAAPKVILALIVAIGLVFGFSPAAKAHAELTASNPIADSVIGMLPPMVELTFGEPLMVVEGSESANQITVTDSAGKRIDKKVTTVSERIASTELDATAGEGVYTVAYRVVSEDGHPIDGKFEFEVSVAAQSGEAEPMPIGEMPSDAPTAVIAPAPDAEANSQTNSDAAANLWPWVAGGSLLLGALIAAWFVLNRRKQN